VTCPNCANDGACWSLVFRSDGTWFIARLPAVHQFIAVDRQLSGDGSELSRVRLDEIRNPGLRHARWIREGKERMVEHVHTAVGMLVVYVETETRDVPAERFGR
jgi:hypothetical protein